MGGVFAYSLCSSVLLAIMYLVYKWLMAGENQHACNRVALLVMTSLSVLLPAFDSVMAVFLTESVPLSSAVEVEAGWVGGVADAPESGGMHQGLTIVVVLYCVGLAAGVARVIRRVVQLVSVIVRGERKIMDNYTLVLVASDKIAPFSWMRYVVMSRDDYAQWGDVITAHERCHLRLCHWIDLLFAELVSVFQWYNPAGWLVREELKTVHEYQADIAVLSAGFEARSYQMLLIKKAVGARFPSLANSLNHSKLKKRVTMMYQKKSSGARRLRALALIPAAAAAVLVINLPVVASILGSAGEVEFAALADSKVSENAVPSQARFSGAAKERTATAEEIGKINHDRIALIEVKNGGEMILVLKDSTRLVVPASEIEKMVNKKLLTCNYATIVIGDETNGKASIVSSGTSDKNNTSIVIGKGPTTHKNENPQVEKMPQFKGGEAAMMEFFAMNIKYPVEAIKAGQEGRVIVRFIVGADGKVSNPTILRGVSEALDAEAKRVVLSMPAWNPGTIDGKPVDVHYVVPIIFKSPGQR